MKGIRFGIIVALVFQFLPAYPATAFDEKEVTILYSGCVKGRIFSIEAWGGRSFGGLARRASAIDAIRKNETNILVLDTGDAVEHKGGYKRVNANASFKMMDHMRYDAMNLGMGELSLGIDFLKEKGSQTTFPFLSTNLEDADKMPSLKEALIKEVGGVKVAILGVAPTVDLQKPDSISVADDVGESSSDFHILPPVSSLQEKIGALEKEVDFVIVLSQLPQDQLDQIRGSVRGIDLIISCKYPDDEVLELDKPLTVHIEKGGYELGYVNLVKQKDGSSVIGMQKKIILDDSIGEEFSGLLNQAHLDSIREERLWSQKQIEHETRQNLHLSPMEYMEQIRGIRN